MLVLTVVKRAWWVFGQEVFFGCVMVGCWVQVTQGIPFDEAGGSLLCEYQWMYCLKVALEDGESRSWVDDSK